MSLPRVLLLPIVLLLGSCATVAPSAPAQPREQGFVIAANPLAARAGMEVLERGGSAIDAAIAVQAMLSLVEPQSSGLGGGAFIDYYDSKSRKLTIYDGRETAPAQATPGMFLDPLGKPLSFETAVLSGRATGIPGVVATLALAHREHGRLEWRTLFGAAERTAGDGFIVSPRLGRLLAGGYAENNAPDVVAYFGQGPGGRRRNAA
jgi:gamma-glutamyltranspeptidase / glutathione hydrolase